MAKTAWFNGQNLTTNFQQAWFGQDATSGHNHGGLNQDGSAPVLNIVTDTTGVLPQARLPMTFIDWTNVPVTATGNGATTSLSATCLATQTFTTVTAMVNLSFSNAVGVGQFNISLPTSWRPKQTNGILGYAFCSTETTPVVVNLTPDTTRAQVSFQNNPAYNDFTNSGGLAGTYSWQV